MKVIVKETGFYAGTWYDASNAPVEMHDRVAREFLPPHGHQLEIAPEPVEKPVFGKPAKKAG